METLNISSSIQGFRNLLPIFPAIDPDSLSKFLILDFSPMSLNFGIRPFRILCSLILSWTTFVKMRIWHLVLNQLLLCLNVAYFLCLFLRLLILLDNLKTVYFLAILLIRIKWLHLLRVLFVELHIVHTSPLFLLLHKRRGLLLGNLQKSTQIDFDFIDSVLDIVLELPIFKLLFCWPLAWHALFYLNRRENHIFLI